MIEASSMRMRALVVCALGWMVAVACGDDESGDGPSVTGGSGGGGSGGGGAGGPSGAGGELPDGGPSGGRDGGAGDDEDAGFAECSCPGYPAHWECPRTMAALCAELEEGCPSLDTWLECGERGLIVGRRDFYEPEKGQCDDYTKIRRSYRGWTRTWVYDEAGELVGVENYDDLRAGPTCGVLNQHSCSNSYYPFVRDYVPYVDGGAPPGDGGLSTDGDGGLDGGVDGGPSALECSRL